MIAPPSPDMETIASLLGRDVIDRWTMTYSPPHDELQFEVETADLVEEITGSWRDDPPAPPILPD